MKPVFLKSTVSRLRKINRVTKALALVVLLAGFSLYFHLPRQFLTMTMGQDRLVPIYSVDTPEKKVAISFDACWGNEHTPKILETLEANDLKTTFFLTGFWLEKYPDLVKKIAQQGHEIGNHTYTHPHLNNLSPEEIKKEVKKTHQLIKEISGQEANLFRPPFGEYSNKVIEALEECGYMTIQWSVDSLDWKEIGREAIVQRVTENIHPGAIVLFHNNGKYTGEALPEIIAYLEDNGYEILPISQLIYHQGYYIDPHTGVQKKQFQPALNEGLDLKVVARITGLDEQQIKEIMGEN